MTISKKLLSVTLVVIMAISMLVMGPASASAASTVRINEVYPQKGYSIVYNLYVQTNFEASTVEGRLNYDPKVLSLTKISFDSANTFDYNEDTVETVVGEKEETVRTMKRISFVGNKGSYDTKSARMTLITAVFKVIDTSSDYTKATSDDAISACFTNFKTSTGYDLMNDENTNITTRTIIAATKLTMAKSSVLLDRGAGDYEVVKVKAVGPVNNDVDSSYSCTYKSSNTKVAKVSGRGTYVKITAVGPGTAKITCTPDGGLTSRVINVTVKQPVKSVTLSTKSVALAKKGSAKSVTAKVTPSNASNKKLLVSSANKKVAKVSVSSITSGKSFRITAVKKGKTSVKVSAADGSKKYAICKVTVKK